MLNFFTIKVCIIMLRYRMATNFFRWLDLDW
jgi:hypothetical protein